MTSSRVRNDVDSIGLHSHYGMLSLSFSRALCGYFVKKVCPTLVVTPEAVANASGIATLLRRAVTAPVARFLELALSFGNFGSQSMVVLGGP